MNRDRAPIRMHAKDAQVRVPARLVDVVLVLTARQFPPSARKILSKRASLCGDRVSPAHLAQQVNSRSPSDEVTRSRGTNCPDLTMVQSVLVGGPAVQKHSATKLTYDDYVLIPDDGLRHEIIEGEHYVSSSPFFRHQRILLKLSYLLQQYLEAQPVGQIVFAPFDVLLSEFNVLVPDLIYLSNEHSHLLTSKNLHGAPDLVVEILSPSTRSRDKRLKRDVYERTGVTEYWVVDPDHDVVEVYRKSSAGGSFSDPVRVEQTGSLTTPLLPGLELPIKKVFK